MSNLHPVMQAAIAGYMPQPRKYTPDACPLMAHEIAYDMAAEQCMTTERLGTWFECVTDERQHCDYFGPIGTDTLVQILIGKAANGEQRCAAAQELRKRFAIEADKEIELLLREAV